jgi:alpha-galactosidase
MFRFADQAWASDNTDPYDRLFIQEGFSLAYPARVMMCWVADPGKWVRGREAPVTYRFHSAMMGSLGIGVNLTEWSEKEMEEARELVEKYKEVRDIIQRGNQYRLLSPRAGDTTAVQYVSRNRSRSVIFVLRNPHRFGHPVPRVYPRGLREETVYQVSGTKELRSGRSLMSRGMGVPLEGDLSSMLIEFTEIA